MPVRGAALAVYRALIPGLDPDHPADRTVLLLLQDVTDRRGWRQEWDCFDPAAKAEIIETWRELVYEARAGTEALSASEETLDDIAYLTGCPEWWYPAQLARDVRDLTRLALDLADSTPCRLDHHGHCQAHGWTGPGKCPQARLARMSLQREFPRADGEG